MDSIADKNITFKHGMSIIFRHTVLIFRSSGYHGSSSLSLKNKKSRLQILRAGYLSLSRARSFAELIFESA
jgi:hypothetical protein